MTTKHILAGICVLVFAGSASAQGGGVSSDSARLQGTWTMIAGGADGTPMPADYVKAMKRVADGPYVTITSNGATFFKAHFVLAPDKSPKEIDYHMMEGPTKGATQLGVYRIAGDTAWFSFGSPGKPRAADFKSVPGDGRTLSVWLRSKP